ncbi:hypothetical protein [Cupriavidus sp. UGS-1]|uniref:hypothetical protein n=1 Tax=Cupriavidus sp. UGS-1 TaxID=2899826 RepID=UPI001E59F2EE|nr:hypothetical protein [Cupriavidus sp. UGS-1]MCD9122420.1 hypothetical protein [Cupriavidus sp. UGS-1]
MAADLALDGLWHGATLYLQRCATSGPWIDPTVFGQWTVDHLRAFPVSSAAMMLGCALPRAPTRDGTIGVALRIAAMVVAMPVLCGPGLQAAAAMPPNLQVAAYLATMWLPMLAIDGGLPALLTRRELTCRCRPSCSGRAPFADAAPDPARAWRQRP